MFMISSAFLVKKLLTSKAFQKVIAIDPQLLEAYFDRLSPETLRDFAQVAHEETKERQESLHRHKKRKIQSDGYKKRKIQQLTLSDL